MRGVLINTSRASDGELLIEVRGELDVEAADRLREALAHAATRVMPTRIVLDLLHVTFIDSAGIGAIAAGRDAAPGMDVGFVLRHPDVVVVNQLRRTGRYDTLVAER